MGQVLQGNATTTEVVRRAIQQSRELEATFEALRHQSEDRCQVEEADISFGRADWTDRLEINCAVG